MRRTSRNTNIRVTIWILFLSTTTISTDKITKTCIQKAGYINCKTFNNCCDKLCNSNVSDNKCIAILGKIDEEQSFCQCTISSSASSITSVSSSKSGSSLLSIKKFKSKSSLSKIDLVAGVLILFIIDMLFLSLNL
uniref:Transmembrane protein n=1 Tax=Parastrongyloides trichosuri TaxID=131310 RepID=A0A0N4ZR61_PARTI